MARNADASSGELPPAEAAFVEYLAASESDEPIDFEAFVASHRKFEAELRRLNEDWLEVARVIGSARDDVQASEVRRLAPAEALRIEGDASDLELEFAGELIRRLARERTKDDRYELRGEIARGGMGAIWKVWDPHLRRQLAMKVILARRDLVTPEERADAMRRALARFLEEAQITSQLDHPGVVPVHDLGIDAKGRVYFTMRLVRGRDFRRVIDLVQRNEEGFTLAKALRIVVRVCEAVAYAHSKGVIHRDLKPANIMVGRFGEVYVMDWGLARILGRRDKHDLKLASSDGMSAVETDVRFDAGSGGGSPQLSVDGRVVGTPAYMAPEQARGAIDEVGTRSDVYALGALLYHLFAGHTPYVPHGASVAPPNIYGMVLAGPPRRLARAAPETPAELIAICEKAMERAPADRYASAAELAAELERYLDHRPVHAYTPSLRYACRLFLERNRTIALTVAAATIVLVGVVATAWQKNLAKQHENDRLLELRSAQVLASTIEPLFPALPKNVPVMQRWLDDVDGVIAKAPRFREQLREARASGDAKTVALLNEPLHDLDRLENELRPVVSGWRDAAAALPQRSLDGEAAIWREAIADITVLPVYHGLAIAPQLGFVPLRRDPHSGLWEFWHVLSGARPQLDPKRPDRWKIAEETGLVFVLIPGGEVELGDPAGQPDNPFTGELRDVSLEPCFVSKYEITQAQWKRVMGVNPSQYADGIPLDDAEAAPDEQRFTTLVHPVETVSWVDCEVLLHRLGLDFPTEDQWEVAARGGARGIYWWEPDPLDAEAEADLLDEKRGAAFFKRENVADGRFHAMFGGAAMYDWDDGYQFHAPVGSFEPNGYGLFDVLGNVREWCADLHPEQYVAIERRCVRGGNWALAALDRLFPSSESWEGARSMDASCGLRPAAPLQR